MQEEAGQQERGQREVKAGINKVISTAEMGSRGGSRAEEHRGVRVAEAEAGCPRFRPWKNRSAGQPACRPFREQSAPGRDEAPASPFQLTQLRLQGRQAVAQRRRLLLQLGNRRLALGDGALCRGLALLQRSPVGNQGRKHLLMLGLQHGERRESGCGTWGMAVVERGQQGKGRGGGKLGASRPACRQGPLRQPPPPPELPPHRQRPTTHLGFLRLRLHLGEGGLVSCRRIRRRIRCLPGLLGLLLAGLLRLPLCRSLRGLQEAGHAGGVMWRAGKGRWAGVVGQGDSQSATVVVAATPCPLNPASNATRLSRGLFLPFTFTCIAYHLYPPPPSPSPLAPTCSTPHHPTSTHLGLLVLQLRLCGPDLRLRRLVGGRLELLLLLLLVQRGALAALQVLPRAG